MKASVTHQRRVYEVLASDGMMLQSFGVFPIEADADHLLSQLRNQDYSLVHADERTGAFLFDIDGRDYLSRIDPATLVSFGIDTTTEPLSGEDWIKIAERATS